jgi:hypothetical protein
MPSSAGWPAGAMRERLARLRVPIGFGCAIAVLWLARPTIRTLAAGGAIACVGEALRIWAAGHLNKSNEITSSGPYRWSAHPLYVGSAIMGAGLAVASGRILVAVLVALYLGTTVTAAVHREEAFLHQRFGEGYDRYRRLGIAGTRGRFSGARVIANHEHRAVAGLFAAMLLLALKAAWG